MRWAAALVSVPVLLVALTHASAARAEGAVYSYEIENDARPDVVLVVWPRACGATGDPLGAVDLKLNPDWATRMNDVDYEVVVSGKRHELQADCKQTSRLYALPTSAFPRGSRESTADDSAIGQRAPGKPFAILPALDAIDRKKRIDFFATDARVLRTPYRFGAARPSAAVASAHEVLAVEGFDPTSFNVTTKRVVYTYTDGGVETSSATVVDAGAPADAGAIANSPQNEAPPKDLGTRWVYLAAVAGLVVGGVIAFFRRKKKS